MNQGISHIKHKIIKYTTETNMRMPDLGTAALGL